MCTVIVVSPIPLVEPSKGYSPVQVVLTVVPRVSRILDWRAMPVNPGWGRFPLEFEVLREEKGEEHVFSLPCWVCCAKISYK